MGNQKVNVQTMERMEVNGEKMEVDGEDDIPEIRSSVGLCGFMELVIHHLMYVKNIYPKRAFKKVRRQGVDIWLCEHPEVKEYVIDFLDYANRFLMHAKESIKICFVLCRRNKEKLEEFYFQLKVKDFYVESPAKLLCVVDNLASICEDITASNTFTDFNTIYKGEREITFELQLIANHADVDSVPKPTNRRWHVIRAPDKAKLEGLAPYRTESNKTYEVKAFYRKE